MASGVLKETKYNNRSNMNGKKEMLWGSGKPSVHFYSLSEFASDQGFNAFHIFPIMYQG